MCVRLPSKISWLGGIDSESEEQELLGLNSWVVEQQLPEGVLTHEIADPDTGSPVVILDLAWSNGLQVGFSQPVAVLLNEDADVLALANRYGYRYFTTIVDFIKYVRREVIGGGMGDENQGTTQVAVTVA